MKTIRMMLMIMIMMTTTGAGAANRIQKSVPESNPSEQSFTYEFPNMKVIFTVNAQGQVNSKTVYQYDETRHEYLPSVRYQANYTENTLIYTQWDSTTKSFSKDPITQPSTPETMAKILAMPTGK